MKNILMIIFILFGLVFLFEDDLIFLSPIYHDNIPDPPRGQCQIVHYTPWEPCISWSGFQFRQIITPDNGCRPSSEQQLRQMRRCRF